MPRTTGVLTLNRTAKASLLACLSRDEGLLRQRPERHQFLCIRSRRESPSNKCARRTGLVPVFLCLKAPFASFAGPFLNVFGAKRDCLQRVRA